MGMLEMGITFSFQQLILDSAIIADIRDSWAKTTLPPTFNDPNFIHDLVALYKGDTPPAPENIDRNFWQGAVNRGDIMEYANDVANEIIHTHKVEPLDRATLNQMRRIIRSAEA